MSYLSRNLPGVFACLACALALGLGACGSDDTGPVRIQLADAPFPFEMLDSAAVAIRGVEVHVTATSGDGSGWHTVSSEDDTVNLLDLQNGVTLLLGETEVPVGLITQIRLLVEDAWVVLDDGREFDLRIPSGEQSGIKIHVQPPIEVRGELADVLLDFDVSRSFHPIPASAVQSSEITEFVFRPSIRAANLSETGSVAGTVLDDMGTSDPDDDVPIEGATVTAFRGDDELTATATESDGHFVLLGLPAGEIRLIASANGFLENQAEVTVVAGNVVDDVVLRLERQ
jgi:hypothetical protein